MVFQHPDFKFRCFALGGVMKFEVSEESGREKIIPYQAKHKVHECLVVWTKGKVTPWNSQNHNLECIRK